MGDGGLYSAKHPGRPSAMTAASPAPIDWAARPKVLLHEHLDGGLRPQTLLELYRARGVPTPADDAPGLAAWVQAHAHSGSLGRYLAGFRLTVAAMASLAACDRVAFEAAEDARADGCVLAEFRIAPLLFEPFGLHGDAVVEALLAGLRRSALPCGLIVCAMRHEPAAQTLRAARLAARFAGSGVIGFDLAGAEAGHPPSDHAAAFAAARDAGRRQPSTHPRGAWPGSARAATCAPARRPRRPHLRRERQGPRRRQLRST
jgi:adenosine deaminase